MSQLTVVSGGQTGVDRAALDVALALRIPCRGWCPAGRAAEDGPIDERYPLTPTPSSDPAQRTAWNVRDSDATLVISPRPLTGGTAWTARCAEDRGRPLLVVDPDDPAPRDAIRRWLDAHGVRVLNVAGPRAGERPGIGAAAARILRAALEEI